MNILYCSETWNLEKWKMENKKLGRWYSIHANCSQFCVYIFKLFQKIGFKIYQINKKTGNEKIKKVKH